MERGVRSRSPDGSPGSHRSELTLVLTLGALAAFGPLAIDTYLPAFSAIARDLHASAHEIDWTLAIYFAGLAAGQIIIGPIADRVGRTRPLRIGLAVFCLASIAAALAPNLALLVVARGFQALGGAACSVTGRAMVRDLYRGPEAARINSRIVLVMGAAPIVAPVLGAALLAVSGWRAIFGFLAAVAAIAYAFVHRSLPETAPRASAGSLIAGLRALVTDRAFVGHALVIATSSAGLFAYISGAPLIFLEIGGVAPATFSSLFALNAAGYIATSQLNARLLRTHAPRTLLTAGQVGLVVAGGYSLIVARLGLGPFVAEFGFFGFLSSLGLVMPNAIAIAMDGQGQQAGNAAAWLGALQFGLAAIASSLVATLANGTGLPATSTMLCAAALGAAIRFALRDRQRAHGAPDAM